MYPHHAQPALSAALSSLSIIFFEFWATEKMCINHKIHTATKAERYTHRQSRANRWICARIWIIFCMRFLYFKYYLDCRMVSVLSKSNNNSGGGGGDGGSIHAGIVFYVHFSSAWTLLFRENYHKYICIF